MTKSELNLSNKFFKTVGVLILFRFIIGVLGLFLQGTSSDLQKVSQNILNIHFSIMLDLISGIALILISVLLYSIMKKSSLELALWLLAFSIIGFSNMIIGNVSIYSLAKLSQDFVAHNSIESIMYQTLARDKIESYMISHYFSLIVHSLGVLAFYIFLFKQKLVPSFIPIFAVTAIILVIFNTCMQIFGWNSSMWLYLPNGILQIFLSIWLIVKKLNLATTSSI